MRMFIAMFVLALSVTAHPALAQGPDRLACDFNALPGEAPARLAMNWIEREGDLSKVWVVADLPPGCISVLEFEYANRAERDEGLRLLPRFVVELNRSLWGGGSGVLEMIRPAGDVSNEIPNFEWWQGKRRAAQVALQYLGKDEGYSAAKGRVCVLLTPFAWDEMVIRSAKLESWAEAADKAMGACRRGIERTSDARRLGSAMDAIASATEKEEWDAVDTGNVEQSAADVLFPALPDGWPPPRAQSPAFSAKHVARPPHMVAVPMLPDRLYGMMAGLGVLVEHDRLASTYRVNLGDTAQDCEVRVAATSPFAINSDAAVIAALGQRRPFDCTESASGTLVMGLFAAGTSGESPEVTLSRVDGGLVRAESADPAAKIAPRALAEAHPQSPVVRMFLLPDHPTHAVGVYGDDTLGMFVASGPGAGCVMPIADWSTVSAVAHRVEQLAADCRGQTEG